MTIGPFQGEWRWLSNFWPAEVEYGGHRYPTVEHAYVAAKTLDEKERFVIRGIERPGEVKKFGRGLTLRADWDEIKLDVMEKLVRQKFMNHRELRQKLIQTGNQEIVELNTWGDRFWGVSRGKGQNHLGRIIMKIRGEIMEENIRELSKT